MTNKEQRHAARKIVSLRASVMQTNSVGMDLSMPVKTIDLSNRGALIEAPEQLFEGEVCVFNLVTDSARTVEVQGRVAWANKLENGVCRAGVAFRNLSVDQEYLLDLTIVRAK